MILHSVHGRLTPNDCAIILMDYQPQLALTISSTNGETLVYNATNLANIARTFNIPTLLTTIGQTSFGGPIFSKLQEIFPDQKPIHRTTLSVFEDARILTILERIGRNKLVIGGLWTGFGVAASVEQARNLGYEVFVVVDACGDVSLRAHEIAIQHILDEGGVAITWLQMLLALHQDWAPPEAYKALLRIVRDHASAYGLEIQYAPPALDEGQTKWVNHKSKERWWEKWPTAPIRSLKKCQKRL
jgi:nicotinamidase-related amidase